MLFIPGDMYDGTAVDLARLAKPWAEFSAPLGAYFITGNHEQFSSPSKYLDAVRQSGIRVLENEKIVLDGLQIVGVHYHDSTNVERFRSILRQVDLDRNVASILLVHNPNRLPVAAEAGISLQLSGHTHRGQYFPFTADRFPHLWKICVRIESLRRSCSLHFVWRRHLGPAHAAGIKPRNCPDPIRVKLRGARDVLTTFKLRVRFFKRILSKRSCCFTPAHKPSTVAQNT